MNKLKRIKSVLDPTILIMTIVYFFANIETILIYSYWRSNDRNNHIWQKFQDILCYFGGREKAIDIFYYCFTTPAWWFVEQHRNVVFFIFITIMMIISVIISKYLRNLSKRLVIYYIICFFVMFFIAFLASSKFEEYYF